MVHLGCLLGCNSFKNSGTTFAYSLLSSGPVSNAYGHTGNIIALNARAEYALLDWNPLNSRLCSARSYCFMHVSGSTPKFQSLFVWSSYAATDCSPLEAKCEFWRDSSEFLRNFYSANVARIADDFDVWVGCLRETEGQFGSSFTVADSQKDNGDHLIQVSSNHRLIVRNISFFPKE